MSIEHLDVLKRNLAESKWIIDEELQGNDYDISGYWVVIRPNGTNEHTIVFEGLDEAGVLPMEKSYACHIQGNNELSLYFGNLKNTFPLELEAFVSKLSLENT
ncbi:hypothetical protein [Neptuniibacter sp. QD37_11]|uniref:hypothetical protein n=1 Tax=Neptuniibacter sp. QD37_11 TaxID=3398209 RepID=UPI0039F495AC